MRTRSARRLVSQQRGSDLARHKGTYLPLFCNEVRFRAGFRAPSMDHTLAGNSLLSAIGAISVPSFTFFALVPVGLRLRAVVVHALLTNMMLSRRW